MWCVLATPLKKYNNNYTLITNSGHIAYTNLLFKDLQLLKIVDIFMLRVFHCNLYHSTGIVYVFLDNITTEPPPPSTMESANTSTSPKNKICRIQHVISVNKND